MKDQLIQMLGLDCSRAALRMQVPRGTVMLTKGPAGTTQLRHRQDRGGA